MCSSDLDAVNGVADDVGACLPDFVQHQQAVIAGSGGIGKTYFRAAPRQQAAAMLSAAIQLALMR